MELDDATCYRACASRDRRFEGRFVIAVRTTGVYCRPGCPAPLPRLKNVRFYACPAAAEEAGFRPCLRCRPETAPGTPAWNGTSATVARALRLIGEGALDGNGIDALAGRLGVGARHLRRLFAEQLGASPLKVARTRRVHFARRLMEETRLPLSQVALGSGFGSVRSFNSAIRETFRRAPRDLRRAPEPVPDAAGLVLHLPFRRPFDWEELLRFLAARAIPGVEAVNAGVYRRSIEIAGSAGTIEVRQASAARLALRVRLGIARELIGIVERVSRLFDLSADAERIASQLRRDPVLGPLVDARPGLRVPGAWDPFELAVRAVLGQQVSVRAASTLAGRLVQAFGRPLPEPSDGLTHLFPSPEALADADVASIGLPGARARSLRALAAAVRDGAVRFGAAASLAEAVARFQGLPGLGPWTAHYVAMRALGEPDAFPASDLGLRRALARGPRLPSVKEVEARAEPWRPWRAYAAMALWAVRSRSGARKGTTMILKSARMETPVGPILLFVNGEALCGLVFEDGRPDLDRWLQGRLGRFAVEAEPDPAGVVTRLAAYLAGDPAAIDGVPVDTGGTPFQRRVWEQLRRIPAGRTASYAEVAAAIGAPSAVRAVGAANGRNPVAIIVPCHRVIASDGTLCGYGGGLHRKRWLLEHEGVAVPRNRAPVQASLALT